jgi:hypothetical protein
MRKDSTVVKTTVISRRPAADGDIAAWRGERHWLSVIGVSGFSGGNQAFAREAVSPRG